MPTVVTAELVLSLEAAVSIEAGTIEEFRELLVAYLRHNGREKMLSNLVIEVESDSVSIIPITKETPA